MELRGTVIPQIIQCSEPTQLIHSHSSWALAGLTCGGAAVLGVLGEGNGPLDAVPLHLLDGLLGQGMHVAEADVVFVRSCRGRNAATVRTHTNTASQVRQTETGGLELLTETHWWFSGCFCKALSWAKQFFGT